MSIHVDPTSVVKKTALQTAAPKPQQQRKSPLGAIQQMANRSPQVQQAAQLQAMANRYAQTHSFLNPTAPNETAQLATKKLRGKKDKDGKPIYYSTYDPKRHFTTWDDADAHNTALKKEDDRKKAAGKPPNFDPNQLHLGKRTYANAFSEMLHENSNVFGPLLTRGGNITRSSYEAVTKTSNKDFFKRPNNKRKKGDHVFSGKDTHSGFFSNISWGDQSNDFSFHPKDDKKQPISSNNISKTFDKVGFEYNELFFKNEKKKHSEVNAVESEVFDQVVDKNVNDASTLLSIFEEDQHYDPKNESEDDDLIEKVINISSLPKLETILALNRASCKPCSNKMAKNNQTYHNKIQEKANENDLDPKDLYLMEKMNKFDFTISSAGNYSGGTKTKHMAENGVNLTAHNPMNWNKGTPRNDKNFLGYQKWVEEETEKARSKQNNNNKEEKK